MSVNVQRVAALGAGLVLVAGVSGSVALASNVGNLVQFQPNTTARASEVNQNFNDVRTAVNSKQDLVSMVCAAGSSIRAIAPNGTVTCEIDDVGGGGGGDITAVNAGSGLSGGGTTGDVTLSIPAMGIDATHLATDSVASAEILNNSIVNADVSPNAAIAVSKIAGDTGFEVGGFWNNSDLPVSVTSLGSIVVTAPGPGELLLFMGGTATLQHNITVDFGIGITPSSYVVSQSAGMVVGPGNITSFFPISMALGYAVPSAGTYTFYALADKNDILTSGNSAGVSDVNLIAVYVPKRY